MKFLKKEKEREHLPKRLIYPNFFYSHILRDHITLQEKTI